MVNRQLDPLDRIDWTDTPNEQMEMDMQELTRETETGQVSTHARLIAFAKFEPQWQCFDLPEAPPELLQADFMDQLRYYMDHEKALIRSRYEESVRIFRVTGVATVAAASGRTNEASDRDIGVSDDDAGVGNGTRVRSGSAHGRRETASSAKPKRKTSTRKGVSSSSATYMRKSGKVKSAQRPRSFWIKRAFWKRVKG